MDVSQHQKDLLAHARTIEAGNSAFSRFLVAAITATDPEDLLAYSAPLIQSIFAAAFARLGTRGDAPHLVTISPPWPDAPHQAQVIDVFSPDMPFIVDSVLAAIRARGGVVRLIAQPVLALDPANPGAILPFATPESGAESYLSVHIDPLEDIAGLQAEIEAVMVEIARVVGDWRPMLERLRTEIGQLRAHRPDVPAAVLDEGVHFLDWLADHNFTLLGMRDYRLVGEGAQADLVPQYETGLGLLADPNFKFLRSGADYVEMTPQHVQFLRTAEPLMVTKANVRSRVHRRSHIDYVGVKLYGADGSLAGELRVLGLFTSHAQGTPHTEVPLIRRKIAEVMRRSGLNPRGHAGKALLATLETYPREELFQIDDDLLFEFATTIATLADRPRVRVLSRIDRFDNFVSVLVFVPRDHYDSETRARIGEHLAKRYDARISAYYPQFPEADLVRVHFIFGRNGGPTPRPGREQLEAEVTALTQNFGDKLAAASTGAPILDYRDAFPADYQAGHSIEDALADIETLRGLESGPRIALHLVAGEAGQLRLKLYHQGSPIPLSDRVPLLENFGFRVIDESTFTLTPRDGEPRFIHDMALASASGAPIDVAAIGPNFEAAMLAVWDGIAESDALNRLTIIAGLGWQDVAALRAYSRYLQQVGLAYSQPYIANVLTAQPEAARALLALFHARHDTRLSSDPAAIENAARTSFALQLDKTTSLDEERILKRVLNLIDATLRTNRFQRDAAGNRRPALALKFDCAAVDGLPQPRPYREIFVYAPRLEGVHLRFGPIARGGLRWSDRPEDFRTEVLGLVKAQQVKNAVIVPVGAKGGFVPKRMPKGADRETVQAEGLACYKLFIASLLDITDNLVDNAIVPPPDVIRRDGDDPYLVVAADKGTASFSDTANGIAQSYGFWLDDAFASGGSVGYDHKKMAITARGAWEAVKRHFRELDRDIQSEPFTAIGVGDMSGDVFGNGMLLSEQTRLVAAFDHRDIFFDPTPDAATSFAERARLFALPRSSWQDYDKSLISAGGGVFPRSAKSVPLSPEMQSALGLAVASLTPAELITAILKAEIDLLWFGGIGTYVRAGSETDQQAGDRANDAVRVTGADLRAKVVGEGANLAMTQRGRVEYALRGGRINTDAIDNSAGVNSSDLEVNIKIALGTLVRAGTMTTPERNAFLVEMTSEVAALCLRNNYLQPLALSLTQRRGMAEFPDHRELISALEASGDLQRAVEFLPDDAALNERAKAGQPLTRPELAVLLAYAKNTLNADLLASDVLDDPYLATELFRYFPALLKERYPGTITAHRLRREVIATVLANAMLNRGGPAYVAEMVAATSADAGQVARAYAAVRDAFSLTDLNTDIDALDGKVKGETQLGLYAEVRALLIRESLWFLRNVQLDEGLEAIIARYAAGVRSVQSRLDRLLPPAAVTALADRTATLVAEGVPETLARRIADLPALTFATGIVLVGERTGASVEEASEAFFGVQSLFELAPVIAQGRAIALSDRFDRMALDRALANLMRAQRDLSADVLASSTGPIPERLTAWQSSRATAISRARESVAELTHGELTVSRLSVAAGLLADLARGT